jgi:hypothetical protein
MGTQSAIKPNCATNGGGVLCSDNAASVQLSSALAEVAKAVFDKPYRALVDILHVSERDAHYRLSTKPRSQRKFTAAEIAKLLQSEEGIRFLVVLMDKQRPAWWKAVLKMGILGTVEERRRADAKLLSRVFHADADTAAGFSAAFRAQDPVFYGAVLAGYDETAASGAPGGAVDRAQSKGRGR